MARKRFRRRKCPDCGVRPGNPHIKGCDVEQCPRCGGQRLSCGCRFQRADSRLPWAGIYPGVAECREYGLFARRWEGTGYQPWHPDDPGSGEDINRLMSEYRRDLERRRFEMD